MARITLLVTGAFVGLTAIGGGIALATGLEGDRFPVAMLAGTPFDSYAVPGLLLSVVVGGSAAVATLVLLRNVQIGAVLAQVAGVVLMGWILGEIWLLEQPVEPTATEVFYFALGAVMLAAGLFLWHAEGRGGAKGAA